MPKPFLTYKQQIQKLKDKHLVIHNEVNAAEELRLNGYFALITGYKSLFKNPTTKDYRDGTTFDDIVALYEFDARLAKISLIGFSIITVRFSEVCTSENRKS